MIAYIDQHRQEFGVEPIITELADAGVAIAPSTYPSTNDAAKTRPLSARAVRDAELDDLIAGVHAANYGVYGARKVWKALRRSPQTGRGRGPLHRRAADAGPGPAGRSPRQDRSHHPHAPR